MGKTNNTSLKCKNRLFSQLPWFFFCLYLHWDCSHRIEKLYNVLLELHFLASHCVRGQSLFFLLFIWPDWGRQYKNFSPPPQPASLAQLGHNLVEPFLNWQCRGGIPRLTTKVFYRRRSITLCVIRPPVKGFCGNCVPARSPSPFLAFLSAGSFELVPFVKNVLSRGQILGRNPEKSLEKSPPCYSQSLPQLCFLLL